MIDIHETINSLSPKKRALLALRNPLSFAQQRLWFLDRLGLAGAAYNLPSAFHLEGRLNLWALECGLNEIIRRHDACLHVFLAPDGQPIFRSCISR